MSNMEAKYIERLEQVVRVLKELPKGRKFGLNSWGETTEDVDEYGAKAKCTTIGCAVGWAASDPWFIRRGLYLVTVGEHRSGFDLTPVYKHHEADSVMEFFGLNQDEEDYLFYNVGGRRGNRADVWRRIESYIKKRKQGFRLNSYSTYPRNGNYKTSWYHSQEKGHG